MKPLMFAGVEAVLYFAGAALVFIAACAVTHGRSTHVRRSVIRACAFALLLTPIGFGVHNTAIFIPPLSALLGFSLLALVPMLVSAAVSFVLLLALPRTVAITRELAIIGAPIALCALIVGVMSGTGAYRERQQASEWSAMALQRSQERVREEVSAVPAIGFRRDGQGVLILSRPAEFESDYLLIPPADATNLRLRLDSTQFGGGEVVSVRNPRNLEWTVVHPGGISELAVLPGDTLLVAMERVAPPAGEPAALTGAEVLKPLETKTNGRQ